MFLSPRRSTGLAVAAFLAAALMGCPRVIVAVEPVTLEIRQVEIGYESVYLSGFITPVWLTLRSPVDVEGVFEVLSPDGDGVPVAFPATEGGKIVPVHLRAGEETTIHVDVKVGPEKSSLALQLRNAETGHTLWKGRFPSSMPAPLPSSTELIVSLGESAALADAVALAPRGGDRLVIAANVTAPQRVPDAWWEWEGVRTVIVPIGRGGVTRQLAPSQWKALREWAEYGGGRLVLCMGADSHEELTSEHPLTEHLPAKVSGVAPLRDLERLHELTGYPLDLATEEARPRQVQLSHSRGRIELTITGQREELPLLVRASLGFGEVVMLALDPDGPTLADWPGRGRLLLPTLFEEDKNPATAKAPRGASRLGYDDLSGQLRMALDGFPQVRVISVTTVAMLTLAYLSLIGPLEYFILRRCGLSSTIAWLSFPLIAIGFSAVGWYAARAAHGDRPLARQCEVVDIDAERQIVRGTTWLHLYSPQTATYQISLSCDGGSIGLGKPLDGWLSWQGLPGKGLGGLAANQLATQPLLPYESGLARDELSLSNMPIQIASSKALSARWWGSAPLAPPLPLTLNQFGLLEGEVANSLPVDLRDCLLVYDEWMYRLKTLSAGQRVRVAEFDMLNLEARLQQRTVANAKDVISPWEPDSPDVPRIMQMMMFHESARGSAYTNLSHRYQGYLDLTSRIRNDRAVLVGRLARPVTSVAMPGLAVNDDGDGIAWTWVRIVLPITSGPKQQR